MLLIIVLLVNFVSSFSEKRSNCIWQYNGSERRNETNPGVIPVNIRCLKGHLEWSKPTGGLQVKFKAPVDLLGSEFSVRLITKKNLAIFYEEVDNGLKILRGFEKYNPKSPISVTSRNGEAGLYVVVRSRDNEHYGVADDLRIDYELEGKKETSMIQGCRMCSALKMAELSCKGDFAVKAKIQNKYLDNDGKHVHMDLHVYHIFRQSTPIFLRSVEGSYHIGRVKILGECSPPRGRQHYIFLGRLEKDLKTARVDCYMKFSLWKLIKRQVKCPRSQRMKKDRVARDIKDIYYSSRR